MSRWLGEHSFIRLGDMRVTERLVTPSALMSILFSGVSGEEHLLLRSADAIFADAVLKARQNYINIKGMICTGGNPAAFTRYLIQSVLKKRNQGP